MLFNGDKNLFWFYKWVKVKQSVGTLLVRISFSAEEELNNQSETKAYTEIFKGRGWISNFSCKKKKFYPKPLTREKKFQREFFLFWGIYLRKCFSHHSHLPPWVQYYSKKNLFQFDKTVDSYRTITADKNWRVILLYKFEGKKIRDEKYQRSCSRTRYLEYSRSL